MNPDLSQLRPEELEPKVTALLLGELEAADAATLREWIARDPALRRLHDDLARTLDLVREAVAQPAEPAPTAVLPRMDATRREALLARLRSGSPTAKQDASGEAADDSTPEVQGAVIPVEFPAAAESPARSEERPVPALEKAPRSWGDSPWLALAACVALLAVLGSFLLPSLAKAKAKSVTSSRYAESRREALRQQVELAEKGKAQTASSDFGALNERQLKRFPDEDALAMNGPGLPLRARKPVAGGAMRGTTVAADAGVNSAQGVELVTSEAVVGRGLAENAPAALPVAPPPAASLVNSAEGAAAAVPTTMSPQLMRRYGLMPGTPPAVPSPAVPRGNTALGFAVSSGVTPPGPAMADRDENRVAGQGGLGGGGGGGAAAAGFGGGVVAEAEKVPALAVADAVSGDFALAAPPTAGKAVAVSSSPASAAVTDKFFAMTQETPVAETAQTRAGLAVAAPAETTWAYDAEAKDRAVRSFGRFQESEALVATPGAKPLAEVTEPTRGGRGRGVVALARSAVTDPAPADAPQAFPRLEAVSGIVQSDWSKEERAGAATVRGFAGAAGAPAPVEALGRRSQTDAKGVSLGDEPQLGALFKAKTELADGLAEDDSARKKVRTGSAERPLAVGAAEASRSNRSSELRSRVLSQAALEAARPARPAVPPPTPQPEVATVENAFSTFSLNVTDVSFKLAGAALDNGTLPDPGSIRSEEFVNAFEYRDPEPAPGRPLAFAWDRAQYPFAQQRDLLRLSVRTAARGREAGRPLNLVLAVDNSGSMERTDRVQTLREAMRALAGQLRPEDRVSLVSFARTARLWLDGLPGNRAGELVEAVGSLSPEGGTNLEDALRVGYENALKNFRANGVNRVVLLTDGAANLGDVEPETLRRMVESYRQRGVALDAFGIGWEGFNDDLLESLTRNGDGRYGFVNSPEEAGDGFAAQLAGALQVAANDVKVQVEFNPRRVAHWRQIGYAKHQLTQEQFRDNTVDAAELGAAEAGNALYLIEPLPRGEGPIAQVRARFRSPSTGAYEEHEWSVPYLGPAPSIDKATPAQRLANTAAAFSEWLASSPFAGEVNPARLLEQLSGVPSAFQPDPRPARLEAMIRQAQALGGR